MQLPLLRFPNVHAARKTNAQKSEANGDTSISGTPSPNADSAQSQGTPSAHLSLAAAAMKANSPITEARASFPSAAGETRRSGNANSPDMATSVSRRQAIANANINKLPNVSSGIRSHAKPLLHVPRSPGSSTDEDRLAQSWSHSSQSRQLFASVATAVNMTGNAGSDLVGSSHASTSGSNDENSSKSLASSSAATKTLEPESMPFPGRRRSTSAVGATPEANPGQNLLSVSDLGRSSVGSSNTPSRKTSNASMNIPSPVGPRSPRLIPLSRDTPSPKDSESASQQFGDTDSYFSSVDIVTSDSSNDNMSSSGSGLAISSRRQASDNRAGIKPTTSPLALIPPIQSSVAPPMEASMNISKTEATRYHLSPRSPSPLAATAPHMTTNRPETSTAAQNGTTSLLGHIKSTKQENPGSKVNDVSDLAEAQPDLNASTNVPRSRRLSIKRNILSHESTPGSPDGTDTTKRLEVTMELLHLRRSSIKRDNQLADHAEEPHEKRIEDAQHDASATLGLSHRRRTSIKRDVVHRDSDTFAAPVQSVGRRSSTKRDTGHHETDELLAVDKSFGRRSSIMRDNVAYSDANDGNKDLLDQSMIRRKQSMLQREPTFKQIVHISITDTSNTKEIKEALSKHESAYFQARLEALRNRAQSKMEKGAARDGSHQNKTSNDKHQSVFLPASNQQSDLLSVSQQLESSNMRFLNHNLLVRDGSSSRSPSTLCIRRRLADCIPKERWRFFWACYVMGIRLAAEYKEVSAKAQRAQKNAVLDPSSMRYMLKVLQPQFDETISQKVQEFINSRKEGTVTKGVFESIAKLLSIRIRSFRNFNDEQIRRICAAMRYEVYDESSLILREGHPASFFYFIINGQCEFFQIRQMTKYRINLVNAGDVFGEVHTLPAVRNESVSTTMLSEFLSIDLQTYFDIVKLNDINHRALKIQALEGLFDKEFIEASVENFYIEQYEPGETILNEAGGTLSIFWITDGICEMRKTVSIVRKTIKMGHELVKHQLVPYEPSESLGEGEDLIHHTLTVCNAERGDHFPSLPKYAEQMSLVVESLFKKDAYLDRVRLLSFGDAVAAAEFGVVAKTKVTVARISQYDFVRHASQRMLMSILTADESHVSAKELQEAFLDKLQWDHVRKRMVGEMMHK